MVARSSLYSKLEVITLASNSRISVPFDEQEVVALIAMATNDCRDPRDQIRFLVRQEARQRGLLSDQLSPGNKVGQQESDPRPGVDTKPLPK